MSPPLSSPSAPRFCHGIVPHYILKGIAGCDLNSDLIRQSARHTLEHLQATPNLHESGLSGDSTGPNQGGDAGDDGGAASGSGATGPASSMPGAPQSIVPSYLLDRIAKSDAVSADIRESARQTMEDSDKIRAQREQPLAGAAAADETLPRLPGGQPPVSAQKFTSLRSIYDLGGSSDQNRLPGTLLRDESHSTAASQSLDVNKVWEYTTVALTAYAQLFSRNGIDGQGGPTASTIHFGRRYANAFFNGSQMIYGDGNDILGHFTESVSVIVHELSHGVTASTGALLYQGQSGALNESFSDVIGCVAEQWSRGQSFDKATWLVGEECLLPGVKGVAIRSMKAPGSAFDDPRLGGQDPQPADMSGYIDTTDDNGGVHLNSGIPNHAFYRVCEQLGGNSWDKAANVWFDTMAGPDIRPDCDFNTFASLTIAVAAKAYGNGVAQMVWQAWSDVGVQVAAPQTAAAIGPTTVGDGSSSAAGLQT